MGIEEDEGEGCEEGVVGRACDGGTSAILTDCERGTGEADCERRARTRRVCVDVKGEAKRR